MSFSFPPPAARDRAAPILQQQPDRRRPRLLLTAARHGLALYRRDRDLPRLLARNLGQPPLEVLTEAEANAESARRAGSATYSFAAHIDILVALLSEQRLTART